MASSFKIGIIAGTGMEDPKIIANAEHVHVQTPFGDPSDALTVGEISGVPCVLLSRHGREHQFSPSAVNYRANIWALKKLGANVIIASSACGSLREEIKPGHIVLLDSFIDRTVRREKTYYDGQPGHPRGVGHIPMHPCFNDKLRNALSECATELGIKSHYGGTAVCIEGPAFSSRAESNLYRQWGGHTVHMTVCPEVYLAKELGIPFAIAAVVTDYDCWRDNFEPVSVDLVMKTLEENASKTRQLLIRAVEKIYANSTAIGEDVGEAKKVAKEAVMNADDDLTHI